MNKFTVLLIALAMTAFNALAAVNINTATQEQLETLNGIGPAKAKAIIDYRNKNGSFKNVEELDKVPGIGQGVLSKIKADAAVSGATTVKTDAKKAEPAKSAAPAAPAKAEPTKPATPAAPATAKPAKPAAPAAPVKAEPAKPATPATPANAKPAKPTAQPADKKDESKADKKSKKDEAKANKKADQKGDKK